MLDVDTYLKVRTAVQVEGLLENYYLPGDLEAKIGHFVEHYNNRRYHESLKNITPADVDCGRGQTILLQRERINRDTIRKRRLQHQAKAA